MCALARNSFSWLMQKGISTWLVFMISFRESTLDEVLFVLKLMANLLLFWRIDGYNSDLPRKDDILEIANDRVP